LLRVSNRLNLRRQIEREDLKGHISLMYYVILSTDYDVKSDFSMSFWYTDDAAVEVEAALLEIKRKNTKTQLELKNVTRGKISEITMARMYPGLKLPEPNAPVTTHDQMRTMMNDRVKAGFMQRPYLIAIDLKFNEKWLNLGKAEKTGKLKELDTFAERYFAGKADSLLVETALGKSDYTYVIYMDHYTDLADYASLLKNTVEIIKYLEDGFSSIIICNHTSVETLESPTTMVRRS
jgi:hypothetical protein